MDGFTFFQMTNHGSNCCYGAVTIWWFLDRVDFFFFRISCKCDQQRMTSLVLLYNDIVDYVVYILRLLVLLLPSRTTDKLFYRVSEL